MKNRICIFLIVFMVSFTTSGQFQKNVQVPNKHHHDLNIEPLGGTSDFIVAGNQFDNALQNEELFVKRVDDAGNIVWYNTYTSSSLMHLRGFDIVIELDQIYVTGSVDVSGVRRAMILKIDAITGILTDARHYDPVISNFNSRGLQIEFTHSDATGDGSPDPGLVVGGFFSDCYNLDPNCVNNNIGFVMRVDNNLNPIWTEEIDTNLSSNPEDYDFVNGITETSDGFFITGSATTPGGGGYQQAVLAYKINFLGGFQWDESYVFGNSNDISVDAYFDSASNKIFMLANYSVSHYFGVTVFNNSGGIVPAQSWYIVNNDLNRYGFTIMESYSNGNNLIITGYDRDENWVDGNNSSQYGETNIFVYEFDKASGNQVGQSFQYLVPNVEPVGDDFNFWLWQMPLVYYPDISFMKDFPGSSGDYYHVGYRREPANGFVQTEMVRTPINKINQCDHLSLSLSPSALTPINTPVLSGSVPNSMTPFNVNMNSVSYTQDFCVSTLSLDENQLEKASVYPNPAQDIVYISGKEHIIYRILDATGRSVLQGEMNNERAILVENLTSGVYFVELGNGIDKVQTIKLIKK